jgi:hypothetical protein
MNEEVQFFYSLHQRIYTQGMIAAQRMQTRKYKKLMSDLKVITLRFMRAKQGYYLNQKK